MAQSSEVMVTTFVRPVIRAEAAMSNCAASVSFEQPLDEALELNSKGPARLLKALREAGSDPYVVHVSTAYAAGQRTGLVLERPSGTAPSEPDVDLEAELQVAIQWRRPSPSTNQAPPGAWRTM